MGKKIFYLIIFLSLSSVVILLGSVGTKICQGEDATLGGAEQILGISFQDVLKVNEEKWIRRETCLNDEINQKQGCVLSESQSETETAETSGSWAKCNPEAERKCLEIYKEGDGYEVVTGGAYHTIRGGGSVYFTEIEAVFEISQSYNIYFTDQETDQLAKDDLCLCGALKLHIDSPRGDWPEGEWFIAGGYTGSPPIFWIDDAQNGFEQTESIDVYERKTSFAHKFNEWLAFPDKAALESVGLTCDDENCILYPKLGVAATNPLTSGKIKIEANDKFEVVQKEGEYYLIPKKIGMGEVTVTIPDLPAYTTLDNIWFQEGTLLGTTKTFKFSITESGDKE